MNITHALCLALLVGLAATGFTLFMRGAVSAISRDANNLLTMRPLSCDLCMAWWGSLVVTVAWWGANGAGRDLISIVFFATVLLGGMGGAWAVLIIAKGLALSKFNDDQ